MQRLLATRDEDFKLSSGTILFIRFSFKATFASPHHDGQTGTNKDR
jgi:hypothetical protein